MGTLLRFPPPSLAVRRRRFEKMVKAKQLIFQAAELLGEMGEGETRVAWLLEDCVGLLEGEVERNAAARRTILGEGGFEQTV